MTAVNDILLWLHLLGLAMGVGLGFAMSQVGPRLLAAGPTERARLWPLHKFLGRVITVGLILLLITGPLMLWLKFGGAAGLGWPFSVKMFFVAATLVFVVLGRWAAVRLERGDEAAAKLMSVSGPLTGISALLAMLFAVITFN
jgi:hypothetical protein